LSPVLPGPVMNSAMGRVRSEEGEATMTSASSTYRGGRVSPAGEAVQMLPPRVPMLRMGGDPSVATALASTGRCFRTPGCSRISVSDVHAPIWNPCASSRMPVSSGIRSRQISERACSWRARSFTSRSVPPA